MTRTRTPRLAPLLTVVLLVGSAGCARMEPPPGSPPDDTPPRPVELRPEYGVVAGAFDGSARVQFDEPLSNPRSLGRDVFGSPAGRYEVKPGRSSLEVRPEDGWQRGVIYYIKLPAGVTDLLRNRTIAPVEWLFSTDGPVPDTEVEGRVFDRVTVRGAVGLRVHFLSSDSVPYAAVSDTGGIFRLPGLPLGDYRAFGFEDQDRDFAYDAGFEPGGTVEFTLDEDTREVEDLLIFVIPADTTAPVVTEARAMDSTTVRVSTDDPLDPEIDEAALTVVLRDTLTGAPVAIEEFEVGDLPPPVAVTPEDAEELEEGEEPGEGEAMDEGEAAEAPEIAPDAPADTAAIEDEGPDVEPARPYVSIRLAEPLAAGVYEVEIRGVRNLRGLEGGGTATFEYVPPPEREPEQEAEPEAVEDDVGAVDEPPPAEPDTAETREPEAEPRP